MNTPLISIVTVVYNAVKTIEETIKSVLNQENSLFEYIIIDGGSKDGTIGIIKNYENSINYWISEADKGIYDAMNKALGIARGDYIYFLGADDLLEPNILSKITPHLNTDKILYGNVLFRFRKIIYDGHFSSFKIVTRNISHQAIFYPKEVFKEFDYNTNYKIFADYDLNLKLYNHSRFSFKYIPLTIALFNDKGTSGLNNVIDSNFEADRFRIIRENFPIWIYIYRMLRTQIAKLIS